MAPEEKTQPEAEVKPAKKPRAPRKTAVATPSGGEAGAPAASTEAVAPAPAKKTRAPRKKTNKPAAETPVVAEAAAPAPVEKPVEKSAEAPAPVVEKSGQPEQQKPRKERFNNNRQKQNKPQQKPQQPAAEAAAPVEKTVEKPAEKPADRGSDIENPDVAPQLPPAPGFAAPETVGGGEGGSGGAIAIATANRILMLEHSIYSVISPEGCASILWRSAEKVKEATEALCLTAQDLRRLGVIDEIIGEPLGGAQRNHKETVLRVGDVIARHLKELSIHTGDELKKRRTDKFLKMGRHLAKPE